jgi:hypothetical protein
MEDDWVYQDEDFDEDLPYVELQFGIDDAYILYDSVKYRWEQWPGGDPEEQKRLEYLKNFLYRVVLEYKFNHQ